MSKGSLMSNGRQHMKLWTLVGLLAIGLLPASAAAQTSTSSIAGVVKDITGAVLPGVTVEAASPALIEKVRTVVIRVSHPVPEWPGRGARRQASGWFQQQADAKARKQAAPTAA